MRLCNRIEVPDEGRGLLYVVEVIETGHPLPYLVSITGFFDEFRLIAGLYDSEATAVYEAATSVHELIGD